MHELFTKPFLTPINVLYTESVNRSLNLHIVDFANKVTDKQLAYYEEEREVENRETLFKNNAEVKG